VSEKKLTAARKRLAALEDAEWTRLSQLRMQLLELHPFWGHLLLQVRLLMAPELEAFAATDCVGRIWFNPNRTRHLSLPQLGFVVLHELSHILLLSGERRRERNLHLWNCATDYAINRMVAAVRNPSTGGALYESPSGTYRGLGKVEILLDSKWDGKVAEAIYEHLAAAALPNPQTITLTLRAGREPGDGDSIHIPRVSDHGGGIDIHLPRGLLPEEAEEVAARVEQALRGWEDSGRRGDAPGQALRLLQRRREPPLPWQALLQRYLRTCFGRHEWDTRRPNRRMLEQGFIAPTVRKEARGRLVVAIDTSASMGTELLSRFISQVEQLADVAPETTLVVADARVQEVVPPAQLKRYLGRRKLPGGGGTDHRPVFDWVEQQNSPPDLFVGISDLYSRFPAECPGYPVLWLAPHMHGPAPFGDLIAVQGR